MDVKIAMHSPPEEDKQVMVEITKGEFFTWGTIEFGCHSTVTLFDIPEAICDWLTSLRDEIDNALAWYRLEVDGEGEDVCEPHGEPVVTVSGGVGGCCKKCLEDQLL